MKVAGFEEYEYQKLLKVHVHVSIRFIDKECI